MILKPGQYLHASCSAEDVYRILAVGEDANGHQTIDVEVLELGSVMHFENDIDDVKGFNYPCTTVELPKDTNLVFRGMQYKQLSSDRNLIVVNAPVGGCYRCCYLFSVHDNPGGGD